ncbi:MAG: DOPA 4,5-dioxygenase family protein [Alphaproteobacteria bacterium]|jgi:aromatic ring-cleaving dioxygenase
MNDITIPAWHAHIYYDPATTRTIAADLREKIAPAFPTAIIGGWHDRNVGPHTQPMYQVAFDAALFDTFVPFLALNRAGLAVLVHPHSTGDHVADHMEHAIWLGEILDINTAQWLDN